MAHVELTAPNGTKWTQPLGLFINNEWVDSSDGTTIPSVNPATEKEICSPHGASVDDVDRAVKAARAAFKQRSWKELDPAGRGKFLFRLADLIEANADVLATIDAMDVGKPYALVRSIDVAVSTQLLRYYGGYADKIHGQYIDLGPSKMAYTIKAPLGVVGTIIPWNFNIATIAAKIAPAVAAGNTVVFKTSETAPLVCLYIANLIKEAGFPPGVVNIINGYGRVTGAAMAGHLGIDKISFTGSTATGREVQKLAAANLKNVTLETGGKSPAIIFDDANLDNAALFTHLGVMALSGQMCTANSRVFVQEGIYEEFLAKYKARVETVSVLGDPFEQTTFQGPLVSRPQYERVLGYVESARSEGATIFMGGEPAPQDGKGFWVSPTVFTDVKPEMKIYREEIFGPCVAIVPFKTEEEVLELANNTTYGLAAAVYTSSASRAHRVAREFESGMVFVNAHNNGDYRLPFGGTKQSGIGSELGEAGLEGYTYTKSVVLNLMV